MSRKNRLDQMYSDIKSHLNQYPKDAIQIIRTTSDNNIRLLESIIKDIKSDLMVTPEDIIVLDKKKKVKKTDGK